MTIVVDLVEPFYGGSHQAWVDGWTRHSRHTIRSYTLPAQAWRWRMRGGAITLAPELVAAASERRPDLVVVSDMIDVSDLIVHTRATHSGVPVVLYLHENQLTYPRQMGEALDTGLAWTTWRNLLAADEVWCNSAFHQRTLLDALPEFLRSVPDVSHLDELGSVTAKMRVLPVGVELMTPRERTAALPLIVSNHRWHHDNDVGAIARALRQLAVDGLDFRVAVVGDAEGGEAAAIDPVLDELGDRVVARGLQTREAYVELLQQADVVVSAARNEFFGVSVIEAVSAGAIPVLPDALAYPETMPAAFHDSVLYSRGELRAALAATLRELPTRRAATTGLAAAMDIYGWPVVARQYDNAASALVGER